MGWWQVRSRMRSRLGPSMAGGMTFDCAKNIGVYLESKSIKNYGLTPTNLRSKSDTFSIFACHPCAGAMLIFSVSFQFLRMTPKSSGSEPDAGQLPAVGDARRVLWLALPPKVTKNIRHLRFPRGPPP